MSNENSAYRAEGTVAPGFESVKNVYERELQTMAEENTQLCVYHKGERVVDLWASASNDPGFSPDSIVNIFSSGKSLAAIAMGALVGRGQLDYQKKIVDYWPEFGAHGKSELTVADLMRHEAGMPAFDTPLDPEHLLVKNIKENRVGEVIEAQAAEFPKKGGSRREYHAITRGWIANEVFRRVDPAGRTIGEFLDEEISTPLEADAVIGVKEPDLGKISKVTLLGFAFQFLQSLKPGFLGRKIKHSIFQLFARILRILWSMRHATRRTRSAPPPFKGMKGMAALDIFNEPAIAMGETPSAAANCSARGLAKIAAMMSAGGKWDGREYLSEEGWRAMHGEPVAADMGFAPTSFTQGGVNAFNERGTNAGGLGRALNAGREGFYGWMGFGGSIFQWHPEHEIGFGFVPTALHAFDILNERGKVYQAEVLRCVENLKS
ncbi:MAG: serine hydrolase [Myxococcota bacterium]|jgi:CubicO group peptidase (beta-lactamase class C family)|nr:serine hydrolase [Myxococcota bacterium]